MKREDIKNAALDFSKKRYGEEYNYPMAKTQACCCGCKRGLILEKYTEIHVWSRETGEYIGNILFDKLYGIPNMTEEEFVDLMFENFPQLKGKGWITKFV